MNPSLWQKFIGSFDNLTKWAFSARKLTAFAIIVCVIAGHFVYYKHCLQTEDFSIYTTVLAIDYIAAGFFLGIITFQQILQFKNGNSGQSDEAGNQQA